MDMSYLPLDDDAQDVDMEDPQDEVGPSAVTVVVPTAAQDGPAEVEIPSPSPYPGSPAQQFHDSGFNYILLKYYDTERQCLTGLCGFAALANEKVKVAVEKILPDLALPNISGASRLTIWKEVDLDDATVIESYRTFEDEALHSGSIIILQNQLSAEE